MRHLLSAAEFPEILQKLATQIQNAQPQLDSVGFIGIHTRGVPLASRLVKHFQNAGHKVWEGLIDINLYGEDLSERASGPVVRETRVPVDLRGKTVFLCDDVLYTGRTVRAAVETLLRLGQPQAIHLAVWARRNGRELPIDTEFVGLDVATRSTDNIKVKFLETDGKDDVTLLEKGEY